MDYIIKKIEDAEIIVKPFPHIIIPNFIEDDDLKNILDNIEIDNLNEIEKKYKKVHYPGAKTTNEKLINRPTGIGLVYSLKEKYSKKNIKLNTILKSEDFKLALFKKLNIPKNIDGWNIYQINKDLNGYEISPHPDITGKVITYQINLSNSVALDNYDLSTKFHIIKPQCLKFIKELSKKKTRPWGKWDWFDKGKPIPYKQNTFMAFAPSDISYHSVKLENYPQEKYQRTMLRGFIADSRLLKTAPKEHWTSGNLVNI
tara:strand:+ start:17 stop:790 length:774 start_codon:yes stop_codon:yes gene_type:complete